MLNIGAISIQFKLLTFLIISKIKDIKRIDLSKLDGVVDEFDELLHKYQSITRMTDRRINKICTLLISRINKPENIINT